VVATVTTTGGAALEAVAAEIWTGAASTKTAARRGPRRWTSVLKSDVSYSQN